MKKLLLAAISVLLITASFQSCKQKKELEIILPDSAEENAQDEWAVIQEPYAAFYEEPDEASGIAAHARLGDVLLVEGRKINDNKELWIKFSRGWIQNNVVVIYSNKLKAESAALIIEEVHQ